MMNNSSLTSDRQTLDETDEQHSKIKENVKEKLTIMKKIEITNEGISDELIVNEETKVMESSSSDVVNGEPEVTIKRKDDGESVKLMQHIKESHKDLEVMKARPMMDSMNNLDHSIFLKRRKSDNAKFINTENLRKRIYRNTCNISHSMRFKFITFNPASRTFDIPRRSKLELMGLANYRYRMGAKPIPTKQWAYMYHRRLIRQNAFCGSWPDCYEKNE